MQTLLTTGDLDLPQRAVYRLVAHLTGLVHPPKHLGERVFKQISPCERLWSPFKHNRHSSLKTSSKVCPHSWDLIIECVIFVIYSGDRKRRSYPEQQTGGATPLLPCSHLPRRHGGQELLRKGP